MTHPDFYRDESLRLAKYHAAVSLGIQLSEQSQSPEDLIRKWHYLNRLSIIPFYSLDDSLFQLMRTRGSLLDQCLRSMAKRIKMNAGTATKKKLLIIKPGLNLGPELSSTVAHFKLLPKLYDVTVVCQVQPTREVAQKLIELDFKLALLPQTLEEMVSAIINCGPDIIVHASNQSAVTNTQTLLGALRLAPIQIATTMSPVTTGLKQIDFYLTGNDNEPKGYSQKYTESMLMVEGDINYYDSDFLDSGNPNLNCSAKLNAESYRELFVGANLNKIGISSLSTWFEILKKTSDTQLVLAPFNPNWQSLYSVEAFKTWIAQLAEVSSVKLERVKIIGPFSSRTPILERISGASLYLDSFPYSGAVSIVDPITTQTRFVTLEGNQARFRQASIQAKRHPHLGQISTTHQGYAQRAIEQLTQTAEGSNFVQQYRQIENPLASRVAEAMHAI